MATVKPEVALTLHQNSIVHSHILRSCDVGGNPRTKMPAAKFFCNWQNRIKHSPIVLSRYIIQVDCDSNKIFGANDKG